MSEPFSEDTIERAALDWLHDTLLPRLISGELRVSAFLAEIGS